MRTIGARLGSDHEPLVDRNENSRYPGDPLDTLYGPEGRQDTLRDKATVVILALSLGSVVYADNAGVDHLKDEYRDTYLVSEFKLNSYIEARSCEAPLVFGEHHHSVHSNHKRTGEQVADVVGDIAGEYSLHHMHAA